MIVTFAKRTDIVIIANFCGALLGERNNRFVYLAELLAKDNAVELITSDFDHGAKRHRETVVNTRQSPEYRALVDMILKAAAQ